MSVTVFDKSAGEGAKEKPGSECTSVTPNALALRRHSDLCFRVE